MHACGSAGSERGAFEYGADTLFVQRMAGLMQYREQRLADIMLVHAGGNPHVSCRQRRAEWMMGFVEATALEVVSNALGHEQAEVELCRLVESAVQAAIVDRRLLSDGAHERDQRFPQRRKQAAYRRRRHAFIGAIDQRIGNVGIGREKAGVLAAKIDAHFQEGSHGGEVVCRPGPRPGVV